MEDTTPDVDNASPHLPGETEAAKKKKKKKRLLGRSKSEKRPHIKTLDRPIKSLDQDQDSMGTPPPLSPEAAAKSKKEGKKKKEKHHHRDRSSAERELEHALALSKLDCADYANQVEIKSLELKQAVQREAFLIRELKELEAKASA